MIDHQSIVTVRRLAEELHFGRAAGRLGISPSVVSDRIKRLEDVVQARLFERTSRKVALTQAGEIFVRETQHIQDSIEALVGVLKRVEREGIIEKIRIGFTRNAMSHELHSLLSLLRTRYPEIDVDVKELYVADQLGMIERGELDVGIVIGPVSQPGIEFVPGRRENSVAVFPKHEKAVAEDDLAALAERPVVFFPRYAQPVLYDAFIASCERCGFSPNIIHSVYSLSSIIALVEAGYGIGFLQEAHAIRECGHLPRTRFPTALPQTMNGYVMRSDNASMIGPIVRCLVE